LALGSTYRLVDIHQDPGGASTYTVTAVKNSGAYAVAGWWWYVGQTTAQISADLNTNHARLISAEQNARGTFDVIMVSNTGSAARAWWWYSGQSSSTLGSELTANNARLVSLQGDQTDSGYTAVMVANTGSDAKAWWWYVGQNPAQISSALSANGARIVDLSVNTDGTFNVVMVKEAGSDNLAWRWYLGASASSLVSTGLQDGFRIFDIQPYLSGHNEVYAAEMIDNLGADNRRIENIIESGYSKQGLSGATFGYEIKPIGAASPLSLQNTVKYEPASGVKALYNLYAQHQVQLGHDSLSSPFSYWYDPTNPANTGPCPLNYSNTNANKVTITLEQGLDGMMQVSDNRMTQGIDLRYGRANVNKYAKKIGLTDTHIGQTLGCAFKNGGSVTLTLANIIKLYEGVFSHTLLNTSNAQAFFNRMNGGTGVFTPASSFGQMVTAEAAKLGKSSAVAPFLAAVAIRDKGGSYDTCFPSIVACSPPYDYIRSDAGILQLPFKTSPTGPIILHSYGYGWWVNSVNIPCAFPPPGSPGCSATMQADHTTSQFTPEIFRAQVDLALQHW
jgi:hypothetical protein